MSAGPADGALSGVMRYDANSPTSNSAIVSVSATGKIQIQATTTTNTNIDVQGYYTSGNDVTAAGGYAPVDQSRIVDTINGVGLPKATIGSGQTVTIQVAGKAGVPAGAQAAFVNFQVDNATTSAGYINPYATSSTSRPGVALNFDGGPYTSIGAIVKLDANGAFKLYLSQGNMIHLLMDVGGYFTAGSSNGTFTPAISKLYDTRASGHVAPGQTVTVDVGGVGPIPGLTEGLTAMVGNLTVIDPGTAGGYARAWASGAPEPKNVASLSFGTGTHTNLITVPVGGNDEGAIQIHNVSPDTVDFILDLQGWYADPSVTEIAVVGGDFVVGETYDSTQLAARGVSLAQVVAIESGGSPLTDDQLSKAMDGTSFDGSNPITPLPGATALDGTVSIPPEENQAATALALTGGVQYSTVSTWLDNGRRTVYLRYGYTSTVAGGGFGYNKIALWHNLNINAVKLVTQHPVFKTYVAGQKYNYEAYIYRHLCTGYGWFRKCKTVGVVDTVVSVDYRTSPSQFVGTFGVVTAYCQGYQPRCPNWVKAVANG
ncbi:hypothetical protein CVV68_01205 [Arthrobacter livingstonensis]|uniref:Uncharacterized protein n=1 Tax=Arthrobacter livingstonensis TaxID=670078 RepID=A0A2V5M2N2_9MICC|nr:hypothetical protein CVV68_01205 [Arthrobacter livingstonensis]